MSCTFNSHLLKHPILGTLQILQGSTQTRIMRCRINRFHNISESKDLKQTQRAISHPKILKIEHMTSTRDDNLDCSIEHFSNTLSDEIRNRIKSNTKYSEDEILALMKDIGSALSYLQTHRSPYKYINGDTIVKVGSHYKLLHPVLLTGYQRENEQTISSINLSQVNIPEETNDIYQKAFDSDHERYKRDVYDFGSLILNMMILSNDAILSASSKLKIASSLYSSELVSLVSKMLEKIISLRLDCIACDYFIQNFDKSLKNMDSFYKKRASGTNLNLSGVNKYIPNSNPTIDNLSIILDHPKTAAFQVQEIKNDHKSRKVEEIRSSITINMFREILKTALPTPENRDDFFADLPSDLSDEAENFINKTFSVKTPRAKPEPSTAKFTDLSLETNIKDNSYYSTVETGRKTPNSKLNFTQVLNQKPTNPLEDSYPRYIEGDSMKDVDSEYLKPQKKNVNVKIRGRAGVDPLTFVAKKRNLQLDHIDYENNVLQDKNENQQKIQPNNPKSMKPGAAKRQEDLYETIPKTNLSEYSALDHGTRDHSADYLTNTSSTNEKRSPITKHPNNIETAKPRQKAFIFGKENSKNHKTSKTHAKKPNGSQGHKKIKNKPLMSNDVRLPSFGDDYGQSDSGEYDVNDLSDQNEEILTTPNSTTTITRKQYFVSNEVTTPPKFYSPALTPIRFITEVYPDGSVYQGEGYQNMRHGVGRLMFKDGSSYEGEWNQDNIEGYGVFFSPNGTIAYEGEWQNNKCNGQGVHYNERPRKAVISDLEDLPRKKEGNWKRYEGGFCNDKWEGEGKLVFSNGDEYCGDFVSDLIHGFGKYFTIEGVVYEGEWANNQLIKLIQTYNAFDGQE